LPLVRARSIASCRVVSAFASSPASICAAASSGEELDAARVVCRQDVGSSAQQAYRRRHVTARQGAQADQREPLARVLCEPAGFIASSELSVVSVGLLEVVGKDFLVIGRFLARHSLEPEGEAFMEMGSELLRHRFVGRVPDEDVTEAEAIVAREERLIRLDELLAGERDQTGPDLGSRILL